MGDPNMAIGGGGDVNRSNMQEVKPLNIEVMGHRFEVLSAKNNARAQFITAVAGMVMVLPISALALAVDTARGDRGIVIKWLKNLNRTGWPEATRRASDIARQDIEPKERGIKSPFVFADGKALILELKGGDLNKKTELDKLVGRTVMFSDGRWMRFTYVQGKEPDRELTADWTDANGKTHSGTFLAFQLAFLFTPEKNNITISPPVFASGRALVQELEGGNPNKEIDLNKLVGHTLLFSDGTSMRFTHIQDTGEVKVVFTDGKITRVTPYTAPGLAKALGYHETQITMIPTPTGPPSGTEVVKQLKGNWDPNNKIELDRLVGRTLLFEDGTWMRFTSFQGTKPNRVVTEWTDINNRIIRGIFTAGQLAFTLKQRTEIRMT